MEQGLHLDAESADARGLVAIGGNLEPETLLQAYRAGVFPWFDESTPICWWSPDPRAILPLDAVHISRRLARTLRSGRFEITINRDFSAVMRGCADRAEGTWITPGMLEAYERLHRLGHAHSIETWRNRTLAGGVYGIAIGGFFAAESMFHRITDGSNVALAALTRRLSERGFALLDVQLLTEHTARFGAIELPRKEYLRRLFNALQQPATFC